MQIPDSVANDNRLTTREKGLYVEIAASEPVTRAELERKGQGRLATLDMLNNLLRCGYITKKHSRADNNNVPTVRYRTTKLG